MTQRLTRKIRARSIVAAALVSVLICSIAGAQTRGGAGMNRMASAQARPAARTTSGSKISVAPQGTRQATVVRVLPDGRMSSSFITVPNSIGFGSQNGVPGLGFDYPHLAAVSGSIQNNRSRGFGRGGRRGQGSFVPVLFGGYPYYSNDDLLDYDQGQQQAQQQPQVIVVQQAVPANAAQQGADFGSADPAEASRSSSAASPVRDVGDFILARRDGRILFASAFSVVGTQMQYITPEGIRHTVPMTDLDADATQQMNEARGTVVQIGN